MIANQRGFLIFFSLAVLLSCGRKGTNQSTETTANEQVEIIDDKNSLFDGKSLEGWEITQFGPQGPVYVTDNRIILNYGDGCTGITYKKEFPVVNYAVTLEARRTSGNDFFCGITFPVKEQFCSLIIGGWGGPVVGLSCIDGADASENETKILKAFEKGQWYKIRLEVTDETISYWIDDEQLLNFNYQGRELYIRPEVDLSRPFGICTWMTTGELREIRLYSL